MRWIGFILFSFLGTLATSAYCRSTSSDKGQSPIIIQEAPRRVPFRLAFGSGAPKSLTEVVQRVYKALPRDQLEAIASYVGYRYWKEYNLKYKARVDFARDLYAEEIIHQAWNDWGFSNGNDPLDASVACAGERLFPMLVIIQVGFIYIKENSEYSHRQNYNQVEGFRQADLAAQQLFRVCDSMHGKAN